jgi:hypothetical protein
MYEEFNHLVSAMAPVMLFHRCNYVPYYDRRKLKQKYFKQGMSSVYIVGKPVLHNLFRSLRICSLIISDLIYTSIGFSFSNR